MKMRDYKPEEIGAMNYIFGKEENNKQFDEFELSCASKIDLFDKKVVNICKIILENRNNKEILERLHNQLVKSLNKKTQTA